MTRNPVGDSEAFSAVFWSAITNGIAQEAIVSGVDPSKGTGDFDVDTTSGEALVQGSPVSVSSATTTLSASGTDDRVDLITVDSGGSVSATQGTPAADPIAPDIPSGEVLVAAVLVEGGASSLNSSGSKIADYRVLRDKRLQSTRTDTTLVNDAGNSAVVADDGSHHRFFAQSSTPIEFRDGVGGIPAGTYTPGASAPNTWDWGGHDFTNINSIDTGSLVMGGTLYEEDANSPIDVSGVASHKYNVDGSYHHILIVPQQYDVAGLDQLQINGVSSNDYIEVDNADNKTTGKSQWTLGLLQHHEYLSVRDTGFNIEIAVDTAQVKTGTMTKGQLDGETGTINKLDFIESSGTNRDIKARVYGREMDI